MLFGLVGGGGVVGAGGCKTWRARIGRAVRKPSVLELLMKLIHAAIIARSPCAYNRLSRT